MIRRRHIAALAGCTVALACWLGARGAEALSGGQGSVVSGNPAPTPEQIHSLIMRSIENQHRDDHALDEFERTEHTVVRKAENAEILTDITERIVPSSTGSIKLKTTENGSPVPPETYRHELEVAVNVLKVAISPTDRYKEDLAKFQKRRHDHDELVDTSVKAFLVTFAGRETRNDAEGAHTYLKFLLDPNPEYEPINRIATIFPHCHAVLWVDENEAQFARLEADIATDISFAAGIAGKVYHGGHVLMVQEEVAPGIWLPTQFHYNVDGRKFLSPFGIHEHSEIAHYRRVGPPPQSIEILRNELNNLAAAYPSR
jgi:hypothetical protein